MFETLEIMISLSTIYLILSMILKYIMSIIKRLLKTKANVVADEMKHLIGDQKLIPLIEKKADELCLLDSLGISKKSKKGFRQLSKNNIKELLLEFKSDLEHAEKAGLPIDIDGIVEAGQDKINVINQKIISVQKKIETYYENTMQKIEEQYKHKMRTITLFAAFALTMAINADFFDIYHSLSKNPLVRSTIAAQAEAISTEMEIMYESKKTHNEEGYQSWEEFSKDREKIVDALYSKLDDETSLQLGWTDKAFETVYPPITAEKFPAAIKKILGCLISGLLISFGAPFWHDFLSSLTSLNKMLKGKTDATSSEKSKTIIQPDSRWLDQI